MTTAAKAVVDLLAGAGVRRFYTVPGESFLELLDEVERRPDLRLISTRHESGAAFMAEADGKLTGRPAVAMATRGVGAANLAIGVHTARQDSTPMLVLLGQVETDHLGKEAFQEVDLGRFYDEITVSATTVHRSDRAAEMVGRALARATTGRPGPAAVAFPADVLAGPCDPVRPPVAVAPNPRASAEEVASVARALASARRPVAIVGGGAADLHDPLRALVEAYGIGVYTAFRRQDVFPNEHPNYLGHLALGTPEPLLAALDEADVVLVLGSRLSEITTQAYTRPRPGARVIQVGLDTASLGSVVPVERAVVATVASFVADLLAHETPARSSAVWAEAHARYLRFSEPGDERSAAGVHPAQVIAAMRRHVPADAVITNDAGNFSVFGHRYWRFGHPRTQVGPTSGAMGYAVPAAIGAGLAAPDRRVVALAGDGGFLMTGQELETAARYGVPLLTVIFQNGMHGTIAMHQARATGRLAGVDIGPVDLAGFARSLGADADTVTDAADLDDAFAAAAGLEGLRVLVVRTDPDVLTPSARLSELTGEADR